MEFKKDLLRNNKKSLPVLILGISSSVISILIIFPKLQEIDLIRVFDWILSGIFAFNGLTFILLGVGTSIERFFGKAFVNIDNEMINFKQSIFAKEYKIYWHEIKSVDYNLSGFRFQIIDDSSMFFSISKLDDLNLIALLDVVSKLAESKGIDFNMPKLA
jgi:hypothetical protein